MLNRSVKKLRFQAFKTLTARKRTRPTSRLIDNLFFNLFVPEDILFDSPINLS